MVSWQLTDVGSTLEAVALFALFTFPPGYAAAWLTDLWNFRVASLLRKIAVSIPLSIGIMPILVYWPWRFLSIRAVWFVLGVVWILFAVAVVRSGRSPIGSRALWMTGLCAAAAWMSLALMELPDIRAVDRVYSSTPAFDYLSRIPLTARIARQEKLPAYTPFFNPGHPVPLRYHYFWPMVVALVKIIGGTAMLARSAVIAGAVWCGLALLCVIALYLRLFQDEEYDWRAYSAAFGLLGITGLDILPVLFPAWDHHNWLYALQPTVEWWNEQVTGWLDAMLWVPHHIAALVAGMLALLILFRSPPGIGRWRAILLAGLLLASAAGMSIYVALVFAITLSAWGVTLLLVRKDRGPILAVAAAGALALLLAAPFLVDMRSNGPAERVLHFTVRQFWFESERFSSLGLAGGRGLLSAVARLAFLPLNYFLELGVYFAVGLIQLRRMRRENARDITALVVLFTSIALATFVRSHAGSGANDIASRGFMPAQFILLLWTVDLIAKRATLARREVYTLLLLGAIGAASTLYDLAALRFYPMYFDPTPFNRTVQLPDWDHQRGMRHAALADSYAWIRTHSSPAAIVQASPERRVPFEFGLYAERESLAMGGECEGLSGRDADCRVLKDALLPLFTGENAEGRFDQICRIYRLDFLVVDDADQVWWTKTTWIWKQQPVFSTPTTRVFACR